MLFKNFLIFQFFLFPALTWAQFVDFNPASVGSDQFPQAQMKIYGIGNLGFNSNEYIYNPRFVSCPKRFYVYTSYNYQNNSSRQYKHENISVQLAKERSTIAPTFSIKILTDWYNFNFVYSKQLSFNQKYKGIYSYGFQSDNSTFVINYDDPIYEISHHIFQLSLSRKLNNIFNITFGLRSNFFKSKLKNSETIEYVEFSTGIFDNIQIITTLNCENKLYNYYVLLKTQNGMNKMDGSGFFDGYNLSFKTEPFVSFPGLFSYGFQYKILEKSNINVEVLHEFLFISNDYYENNIFMDGHNIFNTELYIGSNYEIINGLNLGLMYSKYISYDDEIGLGNKTSNSVFTESKIRNPWSIVFASQYLYKSFRIAFNYQYSKITYKIENDDKIIDAGHFIKLGFGVSY